ncbi:ATP-grasp domain-containing protein [Nocardia sp. NPDC004340]
MSHSSPVLVSVTVLRPEERQITDAIRALGYTVQVANRRNFADHLRVEGERPAFVLMRNVSRDENLRMAQLFERAGIPVLNSAAAILTCSGKDMQALALANNGIRHPHTEIAFTFDDVRAAFDRCGGDVVVKPVNGSWGRGVVRLSSPAQLSAWQAGWESVDMNGRELPVVVQHHVPKAGYDLRALVIGTEVVVVIRRTAEQLRTNTALGGRIEAIEPAPAVRALCAEVVELLGPGFYGVDIVQSVDTGEYLVLEVNANPEFARSSEYHDIDIPALLAAFLVQRADAPQKFAELVAVTS